MPWFAALGKVALAAGKVGAKTAVKASVKAGAKSAIKAGAKSTLKASSKKIAKSTVKKAGKKKLSAKNIKRNILKQRERLNKLQLQRERQEETVNKGEFHKEDSGKGAGNVLGIMDLGIFGKVYNAVWTLLMGLIINKLIAWRKGIMTVINWVKPFWKIVMGSLMSMVNGIFWVFKMFSGDFIGKENKKIKDSKKLMDTTQKGLKKELGKKEFGGDDKDNDNKNEEQEEKKESDKKSRVLNDALKESSKFLESETAINQVDERENEGAPAEMSNPSTILGKVNKLVKGKSDKTSRQLNRQSSEIKKTDEQLNPLSFLKKQRPLTRGLGPTQRMKNKGKVIIQPVEREVRVGGGNGSSGGSSGSSNIKSPVPSRFMSQLMRLP